MREATAEFFEQLRQRGHEPLLGRVSGTIRFDPTEESKTHRWLISVRRGELLDIPGRWGLVDAFGRGRVDVGKRGAPARARRG